MHDHRVDIWVQPWTQGGTDQNVKGHCDLAKHKKLGHFSTIRMMTPTIFYTRLMG